VDEEKLAQLQIPDTIHGLLLARLDRLPPPAATCCKSLR
jgi:hypothetical protein